MTERILFLLVVFLSNIIQCITGFAGTVLAMPFSVLLVGLDVAKPILNLLGLAASVYIVVKLHKSVERKELIRILCWSLPGMLVGFFLRAALASFGQVLLKILGGLVILFALNNFLLFILKKELKTMPPVPGAILLFLGGIVHGVFVCGGPLLVSYASVKLKDTDAFRATLSSVWIILNGLMFCEDLVGGTFFHGEILALSAVSLAVLAVALLLGNFIAKRLKKSAFLLLTYALMLISGISLFLK